MNEWAVATPVDERAEIEGWRQMSARALNASNIAQSRCVALQVLRFWETLGWIGALTDAANSIHFYQEQVEIALFSEK